MTHLSTFTVELFTGRAMCAVTFTEGGVERNHSLQSF